MKIITLLIASLAACVLCAMYAVLLLDSIEWGWEVGRSVIH